MSYRLCGAMADDVLWPIVFVGSLRVSVSLNKLAWSSRLNCLFELIGKLHTMSECHLSCVMHLLSIGFDATWTHSSTYKYEYKHTHFNLHTLVVEVRTYSFYLLSFTLLCVTVKVHRISMRKSIEFLLWTWFQLHMHT